MTDKKYNGWTNWETWSFNLHWDDAFSEDAQMFYDASEANKTFTREEQAALDLAASIKETAEQSLEDQGIYGAKSNLWMQDMVNGYISEVNFYEIAKNYIDETEKESEAATS